MFSITLLQYPAIDPVAFEIFGLAIRWYSLAYMIGIGLGWYYLGWINNKRNVLNRDQYDAIMVWAVLGIVLGGRFGYVLFYKLGYYLENPAEILQVWAGGMSFHGGMIGVVLAIWLFCRKYSVQFLRVMDMVAAAAPIGLFLGRLANFINGELYGRPTESWVGMVFPSDPLGVPRHPSQVYQAMLEGVLLFVGLWFCLRYIKKSAEAGFLSGVFLMGYGLARIIGELFRQPDSHLGFLLGGATMGQILSVPMILLGCYLLWRVKGDNKTT